MCIFLATVTLVIGALACWPRPEKTGPMPTPMAETAPIIAPPGYIVRKLPGRRSPSIVPDTLDEATLKAVAHAVDSKEAIRYVWLFDGNSLGVETGRRLDGREAKCGERTGWKLERTDGVWRAVRPELYTDLRPPAVFLLPARYSRPETTPLRVKVVAGRGQVFQLDLEDD